MQGTFEFKQDTMNLWIDGNIVESTLYKMNKNTLTLKKISGGSPCGDEEGQYTYKISSDRLTITPVKDECGARSAAFDKAGYKKIK
jgi:hypothetical protein